jgi:tight adherence protein B
MQMLALFSLVTVAIGGVAWVFLYPLLSGERNVERRRASVTKSEPVAARVTTRGNQRSRREQVEETLKDLDIKAKKPKSPPLHVKIAQAGLSWTKNQFFMICGGLGLFASSPCC